MDIIPLDLQKEICDFARKDIWPAVLVYLGNIFPDFRNFSVADLENYGFYLPYNIEPISRELNYDLQLATGYQSWPDTDLLKIHGKRLVGSFIRICDAIGKKDLGVQIRQIVEKCFTPDEHQDRKDSFRADFGLYVESSTGGIQCSCCKGE